MASGSVTIIDVDVSKPAHIVCRKADSFDLEVTFKDTNGLIQNITTDTFTLNVVDDTEAVVLAFTMGNGCTVAGNKLYLSKTGALMDLPINMYRFALKQVKVGGTDRTRMSGPFEIIGKYE